MTLMQMMMVNNYVNGNYRSRYLVVDYPLPSCFEMLQNYVRERDIYMRA